MMVTGSKVKTWHNLKPQQNQENPNISDLSEIIYVSDFNLIFVYFDASLKKVWQIKSYHFPEGFQSFDIDGFKNEMPEFINKPKESKIFLDTRLCTLLPKEFNSDEDVSREVFSLNFSLGDEQEVSKQPLNFLNADLLYSHEFNLNSLQSLRKTSNVSCVSAYYLEQLNIEKDNLKRPAIFIDFNKEFLKIAYFENDLKFFNSFPYKSKEEALYHILNIAGFFKLKTEEAVFYISGFIQENFEIYKLIYKYIRFPYFLKLPQNLQFGEHLKMLPAHIYYNIFAAISCE
jgi:hypothetical protein